MKETEAIKMLRREFLAFSSLLLLSAGSLKAYPSPLQTPPKDIPKDTSLGEELSTGELEIVDNSIMAREVDNYLGKGYSCAESGLIVALRFMKRPEGLVWAAGGFGGGIGHQDLCGFLTAGVMAIGIYTGALEIEKKEAKEHCSLRVNEYWSWWTSTAPLHCSEIREGHKGFKVCSRLGKLASAELENILKTG
jgi:hypothetical protein